MRELLLGGLGSVRVVPRSALHDPEDQQDDAAARDEQEQLEPAGLAPVVQAPTPDGEEGDVERDHDEDPQDPQEQPVQRGPQGLLASQGRQGLRVQRVLLDLPVRLEQQGQLEQLVLLVLPAQLV